MNDEGPETADSDASEPEAEPDPDQGGGSGFNWWLLTIPAVAVVTLVVVLLFAASVIPPSSIHESVGLVHVVIAGAVILLALLIAEIVLLVGGHPDHLEDDEEPAPGPETPAARDDVPAEEPVEAGDLETVATDDEVEGRRVLEMARPPKRGVDAGVYSTTYVEIDDARVLRVEELVAERARVERPA